MDDTSHSLKPWLTFAGGVLVIVVLYWAQAVLVPIALAVLLTFVLTPAVGWLERWLSRVTAVLAAATLVFIVLGVAGWGLARQMDYAERDSSPARRATSAAVSPHACSRRATVCAAWCGRPGNSRDATGPLTRALRSGHLTWTFTPHSLETSRVATSPFISSIR